MKLKQHTYVIKQETSNGFPGYVEIEEYDNRTAASMGFIKILAESRINYDKVKQTTKDHFLAYNENMKGECLEVVKTKTKKMRNLIKKMVDQSKEIGTYKYLGEHKSDSYEMPITILTLKDCRANTYSDIYGQTSPFTIDRIIRRPEDPESPKDNEYVYDIVMHSIEKGYEFIESVDWTSLQTLSTIYMYLISNNL